MDEQDRSLDYPALSKQGTGNVDLDEDTVTIVYPFGRYEITVRLTIDGRFVGIEQIKVNTRFLDHLQRLLEMRSTGYHDLDDYYKLEEEE